MASRMERSGSDVDSLEIIRQWGEVSPEHLKAAMKALDAQLVRTHELRMAQERARDAEGRRSHVLFMTSMLLGFMLMAGMATGAVVLGLQGQVALPVALIAAIAGIGTVFVLRKHEPKQIRAVIEAQAKIARSQTQALPAPPPEPAPASQQV